MQAAAHDPAFAAKAGVPQTVAREFTDADKAKAQKTATLLRSSVKPTPRVV